MKVIIIFILKGGEYKIEIIEKSLISIFNKIKVIKKKIIIKNFIKKLIS